MAKIIKRNSHKVLAGVLMVSMFGFYFSLIDQTDAAQVSSRSDTMNNSNFSATSNHTIQFTLPAGASTGNSLETVGWNSSTGETASATLTVTFGSGYVLTGVDCGDVDLAFVDANTATSIAGYNVDRNNSTYCVSSATSWGLNISGQVMTFHTPTTVQTYVASGTLVVIRIGSNATFQDTGAEWITNPAGATPPTSPPQYPTITIGGSFGGTGTIMTAILQGVEVSATVAETLTIALAGLPGHSGVAGGSLMSVCGNNTANPSADDEEPGTTVTFVTTTATTVPFGTINTGIIYQGCQKLSITTNAANGFTVRTRENNPLRTPGGIEIANASCNGSSCLNTPSTSGPFTTAASGGFGIGCANAAASSYTCSTSEPTFASAVDATSGIYFAPIAYEGIGSPAQSPARVVTWSTATGIEIINKIKYRLLISGSQGAGVYTNLVSFIVTAVF